MRKRFTNGCTITLALAAALALAGPIRANAQADYPTRNVRVIVPYAAGGAVDPMARLMADRLTRSLGQTFVVENRPGAGGNIGIESAVHATPDGYTLLVTPSGVAINPSLYAKVPYDLEKDLTPVAIVNRVPMIVMATPSFGVKSIAELIERAKAKPKTINYAISGNGTLDHLVCERLRAAAGLDMVKVNYQGVPKGITALLSGEVQIMVAAANAALPYIQAGQVVPLAVTTAERSPQLPDVPTMAESGFPDFAMAGWTMLFAQRGVPDAIVTKLHDEVVKAVADPAVKDIITKTGGETPTMSLDELKTYVRKEAALFADIVRASGARVD